MMDMEEMCELISSRIIYISLSLGRNDFQMMFLPPSEKAVEMLKNYFSTYPKHRLRKQENLTNQEAVQLLF